VAAEIITRIKEEFSKLENINNPYDLSKSTTDIIRLLAELNRNKKYEEIAMGAIVNITATFELEIGESIDAFKERSKENISENIKGQYHQIIKKAATQVRRELMPLVDSK
jgi:hypothetical protein